MRLRIVFRSYGGENMKNRPPYYRKLTALRSAVRAAEAAGAEITFMNDGPMPEDRLAVMRENGGEIVTLPGVGMRKSYVAGLRLPSRRGWAAEDLVWFSEDDYLYTPDAFVRLIAAAERLPDADYFGLYGDDADFPVCDNSDWTPPGWDPGPSVDVDGQQWSRIVSTASTFGVRAGALRQDLSIFVQGLLPHKKMYRDHDTCVVFQGYRPHEWDQLLRDVTGRAAGTPRDRVREAALAPFKAALNVRAHRRPENRRTFVAAFPNLATHLEVEWLSPGRDWAAVAADTERWWAEQRSAALGR
ncbi:MAG: hypothetical protein OJJ54_03795 [Pseudonocardia sp.]|nr:hypothetical protein [Pseudonocardia sp.]